MMTGAAGGAGETADDSRMNGRRCSHTHLTEWLAL